MRSTAQSCSLCDGTGYVTYEDRERSYARRCECFRTERVGRLGRLSRVPRRYEQCSFENYDDLHPLQRAAKEAAHAYTESYPTHEAGLLFLGPCGVGKTHLAVAILKALVLEKGVAGLFYDFRDLLKEIQNSYNPVAQASEVEILQPVLKTPFLVLDDLGARKPTVWVEETLAHIINQRYNEKRPTVFTSNFLDAYDAPSPGQDTLEERIGTRLRSRLYEMCKVILIQGEDYRKTAKQAGYHF
ncbi:MAG: ATP-binding protein [Acidobacteriota bacterium]